MVKKHERTLKMIDQFPELWNSGMVVQEIAPMFNLSDWTVYHYLQEIADNMGVPRETLLTRCSTPHYTGTGNYVKPVDFSGIYERLNKAKELLAEAQEKLRSIEDTV